MAGFDIATLTDIRPARWLCVKCNALLQRPPSRRCDVCGLLYGGITEHPLDNGIAGEFLGTAGRRLEFPHLMDHAAELAHAVQPLRDDDLEVPPLRVLFDVLARATEFIHFISYGMTWELLGVLAMVARRIPVMGVVNNTNDATMDVARSLRVASPWLNLRRYQAKDKWGGPHQKMIVVDGLLVLKGSANLTLNSWLEAASGNNELEAVTDIGRVVELNNRYFAPKWAELSHLTDSIIDCRGSGGTWRYALRQPSAQPPASVVAPFTPALPLGGWIWTEVTERVEKLSRVTAAFLRHTSASLCGNELVVEVPHDRRFEQEALSYPGRNHLLLEVAQGLIGSSVEQLRLELGPPPPPPPRPFDDEPPF